MSTSWIHRLLVIRCIGKRAIQMVKVEDFQQFGKEQFDTAVATANTCQKNFQAIATAFGDYAKKSFEDGNAFVEQLAGSKSWDKALEVQADYAKSSFESFVAESQKIGGLYADIAKQAYKPFEGFVAKLNPAR